MQLSAAPNIAAGGKPRIVGGPRVGRTVAADTGEVFDLNGLSGVAFAYQWVRVDGGTETDIAGATASTYMPVAADVNKTLKVRVTFTDDNGYAEARTSDATATVTDTATDTDTALVALTLEAVRRRAVALDPAFAPATTAYEASVGSSQVTIRATTRDNDASVEYLDGDDMELEDADGMAQGFQVALAEGENTVKVTVTAEDGNSTRTYEVTITRAQETAGACLSDVAWCATLTVGVASGSGVGYCGPGTGNSNCDYGSLSDNGFALDDGTNYTVESIRWGTNRASDDSVHLTLNKDFPSADLDSLTLSIGAQNFALDEATRGNSDGPNAIANNYRWKGTVPPELLDLGEDDTVTVQLNEGVNAAPAFASASVGLNVDEDTAPGTSLGAPVTATDADSDPLRYSLGEEPGAASFAIDPASGQLWTALALDHETGASHTFTVRADDGRGGTDTVEVTVTVDDVDEQPARPAAPTVAAAPGSATALDVAWAEPALRGGPAITGYKVQRRLSVGGGGGSWTAEDVSGAGTRTTLTGLAADTAYQVRVRALNGETASAWSVPTTGRTGSAANTAPTGAPAIDDGTPVEGAVLGVDVSGISDEDGLSSPDYAYQWEREAAGVWTGIAGASGESYRVGAADVGAKLRVRVSFTDDGGTRETLTSPATETVLPFVMTGVVRCRT